MRLKIGTLVFVATLTTGVAAAAEVIIKTAPPPPVSVKVVGKPPSARYVWTPGYYKGVNGRYVWVAGKWMIPPRAGAVWVAPRWNTRPAGGYIFVPGYWR